jgi:hypothetical protein
MERQRRLAQGHLIVLRANDQPPVRGHHGFKA